MKTSDIKIYYLRGWSRDAIAREIMYHDHDIDYDTAMLVVAEVLLKLQRKPVTVC